MQQCRLRFERHHLNCADKDHARARQSAYKWLVGFLEALPPQRAQRYASGTLSALVDLLRQEDSSRSREAVLQALEVVLTWRASSVDARHINQVHSARCTSVQHTHAHETMLCLFPSSYMSHCKSHPDPAAMERPVTQLRCKFCSWRVN